MYKYFVIALTFLTSCCSNIGTGAIAGTILGAGVGSVPGGILGGLIGSASGLISGSLIGSILDTQDRKVLQKTSPRTVDRMDRGEPLTINDIIKLSQSGVSDETVIKYISESSSVYNLSQSQIRRMQEAGVSGRVINYMIDTAR